MQIFKVESESESRKFWKVESESESRSVESESESESRKNFVIPHHWFCDWVSASVVTILQKYQALLNEEKCNILLT